MNLAQTLLSILELVTTAVAPILTNNKLGSEIDAGALALEKIVGASLAEYSKITGKPMDLSTLQPITPVD